MNEFTPNDREILRDYILDTLTPEERDQVEANLLESPSWQEALEAERAALSILDDLLELDPPEDLADRTLATIEAEVQPEPKPFHWARLAVTLAVVGVAAAILLPALSASREAARRSSAENNMKQIGLAMKMYANESPGEKWPPMSPYKNVWMFDLERLYPKYLTDITVLVDPNRSDAKKLRNELTELAAADSPDWERMTRLAALSFTYVGWAVNTDEDARMLASVYPTLTPDEFDLDVGPDERKVYRLREGIERFLITDINNPAASAIGQSEVSVIIRNSTEEPSKMDVLYLDGHVERDRPQGIDWLFEFLPQLSPPD